MYIISMNALSLYMYTDMYTFAQEVFRLIFVSFDWVLLPSLSQKRGWLIGTVTLTSNRTCYIQLDITGLLFCVGKSLAAILHSAQWRQSRHSQPAWVVGVFYLTDHPFCHVNYHLYSCGCSQKLTAQWAQAVSGRFLGGKTCHIPLSCFVHEIHGQSST